MPHRDDRAPQVIRIVEGLRGRVPMEMTLSLRPDYGAIEPWTEAAPDGIVAAAGPDAFRLSTPLPLGLEDGFVRAEFTAIEGARERFVLTWNYSFEKAPPVRTPTRRWRAPPPPGGSGRRCTYDGEYRDEVLRSLITLKAMTHEKTGALVAAPTTSLPEDIGGVRNWDYRYCWLRDSALALGALFGGGYFEEGVAFRDICCAWRRAIRQSCRSCTGSGASADSPSSSWTTSRDTRARSRSASGTLPSTSSSSTSTARSHSSRTWRSSPASPWRDGSAGWASRPRAVDLA